MIYIYIFCALGLWEGEAGSSIPFRHREGEKNFFFTPSSIFRQNLCEKRFISLATLPWVRLNFWVQSSSNILEVDLYFVSCIFRVLMIHGCMARVTQICYSGNFVSGGPVDFPRFVKFTSWTFVLSGICAPCRILFVTGKCNLFPTEWSFDTKWELKVYTR